MMGRIRKYCFWCFLLMALPVPGQEDSPLPKDYSALEQLFEDMEFDSIHQIDEDRFIKNNKAKKGEILEIYAKSYESINQDDKAFDFFKRAKDIYLRQGKLEKVAGINALIYNLLDIRDEIKTDKASYLKEIKAFALKKNSKKWMLTYYKLKGIDNFKTSSKDSAKTYFFKAKDLAIQLDSLRAAYELNINIGALYLSSFNQPDSAIYYYKSALKSYRQDKEVGKKKNELFALYNNIGNAYREQKNYKKANKYYKQAEKIDLKRYNDQSKRILYNNMEVNYYYMNDFKNAYNYLYKYDSINDIIKMNKQNANIKDIEEKYQNEKLRADNLAIESKRVQNRNIALALGSSIVLGSIILFLFYKNNQRKREIAKQKQNLRMQKLSSQLKEQELRSIDAMIEGQEKERLRLANDLHDDLGSLMSTIKMHFSSISGQDSNELYHQTRKLIDEAYQKIRNIAHSKNSGVLAKQGLYKAVRQLAKTISASESITINVHENGLDQRLENSLELTLFRIVQELITNIIKHAEASEVDIHFNQHDEQLNIMVEDDGKGFDPDQITKNSKGMGLSSIDKRVEHLEGKMIIESKPKAGTTIIIEIPIE